MKKLSRDQIDKLIKVIVEDENKPLPDEYMKYLCELGYTKEELEKLWKIFIGA